MTSIGHTLKEARTKKAVTLEEVHAKTRIHPRVLQLLEEEKFDKLPGPLFVKSFLRSYARFLEVNAEELVQVYEKEKRKDPEQFLFIPSAAEKEGRRRPSMEIQYWIFPFAAGLLVLVVLAVAVRLAPLHRVKSAAVTRSGPGVSAPALPGKKGKQMTSKRPAEWLRSVSMGNFPVIDKAAPLKLEIKAIDNVWLRVTCDGKVLFQAIVKKGYTESWTADKSVEIWTGNSSNMMILLNGHSLGSPGKGVIKKMVITHEGVKIPS